jgi:hypothetical protein
MRAFSERFRRILDPIQFSLRGMAQQNTPPLEVLPHRSLKEEFWDQATNPATSQNASSLRWLQGAAGNSSL